MHLTREELVFVSLAGHRLKVCRSVAVEMYAYMQDTYETAEAGGVLLGRYILNSSDVVVDEISTPVVEDCCTRTSFLRSAYLHQQAIDAAWFASGGTRNYLGEWHTHPEPDPSPSPVDMRHWRKRLLDRIDSDILYFVILGTKRLNVWQVDRTSLTVERLYRA